MKYIAHAMHPKSTGSNGQHIPFMFVQLIPMQIPGSNRVVIGHRLVESKAQATGFDTVKAATLEMNRLFLHGQPVSVTSK